VRARSPYPIRPIGEDELEGWARAITTAFGSAYRPAEVERDRHVIELDRTLAAYDGERIVGTADALSMRFTVPGGTVPVAGVSAVSVSATHRRRGVLASLMRRQLDDVAARGEEAVAALWASEAAIYGRFGYGPAAHGGQVELERTSARLRPDVPGADLTVRQVDEADAARVAGTIWDRIVGERPGRFARDERWWRNILADPEHRRHGFTPWTCVVADGADGPSGFAFYRTRPRWEWGHAQGTVKVDEVVAASPGAYGALWRHLLGLDLMRTVAVDTLPIDDPLPHLLTDARQAAMQVTDNLWMRLVDVGRALAHRRYAAPVDLVLDVGDEFCPGNSGRWRLSGDQTGATCERTSDSADLALGVEALGAAYLGDPVLTALAAAGRVDERRPGALMAAAAGFGWPVAPHCPLEF
jgi:predicted acetyltransferase